LGNPYVGHTLHAQLAQVRLLVTTHAENEGPVDMGYRGNNHKGPETIIVDKRRRGTIPKRVWKGMKRRVAIEPNLGHLKAKHRLERNRLKGTQGNAINALLSAAAMNFQKLLGIFFVPFTPPPSFVVHSGIPGSVFGSDVVGAFLRTD
jgi:IS5 family transposase